MKKIYVTPLMEVMELEIQASIAAASGPSGKDGFGPSLTDETADDGPGAGDHGGTPNKSNYNNFDEWEDEDDE